ncbi:MAG: helix-turn-helix transcriptional regulator [Mobilitalea sp.]
MSTVSKNIKAIRIKKKITQEDAANKLFVTRQTISNWETGKSQPDIDMLIKIAEVLETDITSLIYGQTDILYHRKAKLRVIIPALILLFLIVVYYVLNKEATELINLKYSYFPRVYLQLLYLPLFWILFGWTLVQSLSLTGAIRLSNWKYKKGIGIVSVGIVILYFLLMLPLYIEGVRFMMQLFRFNQNPGIQSDGMYFSYKVPYILNVIEQYIIKVVYNQPIIFIIPGIVWAISKLDTIKKVEQTG